jgi:hypothetical protein
MPPRIQALLLRVSWDRSRPASWPISIAVPGNPLEDLSVLEDVRLVMLGGEVVP